MVPDRRHRRAVRLAPLFAVRVAPADAAVARRAEAEAKLAFCRQVRDGLTRLGLDPDQALILVRNEADARAVLAAPPEPEVAPDAAAAPPADPKFDSLVAHYRDPDAEPPNLAKESLNTLWAFVVARGADRGPPDFSPLRPSGGEGGTRAEGVGG